jgi:hypothetical protein
VSSAVPARPAQRRHSMSCSSTRRSLILHGQQLGVTAHADLVDVFIVMPCHSDLRE